MNKPYIQEFRERFTEETALGRRWTHREIYPVLINEVEAFIEDILARDREETISLIEKERDMHILRHPALPNVAMFNSTRKHLQNLDSTVVAYNNIISLLKGNTKL